MRHHYTTAVVNYFEARPNQWISAYELMAVGGKMAWRSRVSNARRDFQMTIENKVVRDAEGVATSYYRFVKPADAKVYEDLIQIAEAP